METSNMSTFRIIQKKQKKKIGEFRLFHRTNLFVFIDFKDNKITNKGNSSDFFRMLNLYRKATQYCIIENLDDMTKKTEELFNSGRIVL